MFDAISYPVSWVMKLWHAFLSLFLDADSGLVWVLTIIMLVFTVRLILLRPMWRQMYSMRRIQQLQPRIKALQEEHKEDPQRLAQAIRELQHDEQVSFAAGCLPALIQIPVFFGLYHVLTQFSRNGISVDEASTMNNGAFGPAEVSSFLHADLLGVPLATYISMPSAALAELDPDLTRLRVILVAFPLLLIAGGALFINMRRSTKRSAAQQTGAPDNPLAQSIQDTMKLMVWIFPLFPIVGGLFLPLFPVAICLYWAVNNLWTMVQVEMLTTRLDSQLPIAKVGAAAPGMTATADSDAQATAPTAALADEETLPPESQPTAAPDDTARDEELGEK